YGNRFIDTPNIDRFAQQSVRFTNAYAACPVCSPTRASIMTGKYPARLHLTDWIPGRKPFPTSKLVRPEFNQSLPMGDKTIAEMLSPHGYRTAAIGKWHLGGEGHLPSDRGFGTNIAGTAAGSPPRYFGPLELPGLKLAPGEFLTQRLSDEGVRFMGADRQTPFFLYQAHFTVHLPLQAREEVIAKYRKRDTGDVNPVYCAMVESADDSMGQLMKALDDSGQAANTAVIFFSDNGAVRYQGKQAKPVSNNAPLRAGKGHLFEGGIREPLMIRWPGITKAGTAIDDPVSSIDFFPTICEGAGAAAGTVDGVSLMARLRGGGLSRRPLFWHYPHYSDQGGSPGGAVREGEWKLIEFYEDGRLELFHLADDPGERRNLVRREPGRVKWLHGMLADWRKSVNASMPAVNPNYDPANSSEGLTGYEPPTPPA
ncbi:MAG: sulfatase, partial [Acidobacteriota bacterium]|nr:sulfatase [Acidobacteriota bacterium]